MTNKTEQKLKLRFNECISEAAEGLRNCQFEKSYDLIIEAMGLAPSSPQPHNLLGIWFEMSGNEDMARRHFRAAYSLDPTFTPACRNLERICEMFIGFDKMIFDFGNEQEMSNSFKNA